MTTFKELSRPLQIGILGGWISFISFIYGVILGLMVGG
jgi:hypothetical protein